MESKHKIIIVEDHQLFRDGLKAMLTRRGDIDIIGEAEDGIEALKAIRKLQPDMVLLDLSMPKMSGISVLKEIKRESPDIRILLSGNRPISASFC
jgi:DNA-binding NarL/FixJ family response regulator